MNIRLATERDIDQFRRVIEASILVLCADDYNPQQLAALLKQYPGPKLYRQWLRSRVLIVAKNDTGVVGFAQFDPDTASIEAVHVDPEYTHCGIGRGMVNEIETIARQRGIHQITLDASINADKFYAKCGYTRTGPGSFRCNNGIELATIAYEKSISE